MRPKRWTDVGDQVEPAVVVGAMAAPHVKADTEVSARIREIALLARAAQDDVSRFEWLQLRRKLRGIRYLCAEAAAWQERANE